MTASAQEVFLAGSRRQSLWKTTHSHVQVLLTQFVTKSWLRKSVRRSRVAALPGMAVLCQSRHAPRTSRHLLVERRLRVSRGICKKFAIARKLRIGRM
jgi:hypothetical protein